MEASGGGGGECHAAQVVDAGGEMDAAAMERFAAAAGLPGRGLSYAVVSILGPQGSGTSPLPSPLTFSPILVGGDGREPPPGSRLLPR